MSDKSIHGARFVVIADPDPGLLVKIVGVIRLANRLPSMLKMARTDGRTVVVEVEIDGVDCEVALLVRRKLEQLIEVQSALFTQVELGPDQSIWS